MAGNSLIGLIRVDSNAFDQLSPKKAKQTGGVAVQKHLFQPVAVQGSLLPMLASSEYDRILQEKNQSIALYKQHAFELGAIQGTAQEDRLLFLRKHIEQLNQESQQKLNQILLDEFSKKLGIKYEEAQVTGKPKKWVLNITDINNLEPFHWGYHFDSVFAKGGFDAIIAKRPADFDTKHIGGTFTSGELVGFRAHLTAHILSMTATKRHECYSRIYGRIAAH
jgi:hypothetical protein